ncbi:hypothetical protein B0H65DRAFT_65379 [Neurospora tetraspora]|uniref:FAD-binding PCMH-type domain-containing protein n=1 Tax=Neurospora tetraspora TaxID=94610 RepID=A0AAE0JQS4_9PEZI|nr:hypothetical protein B0H65DRAFT_65379 [Neurospora tetraspora]
MTRLHRFAVSSALLLQSLACASPEPCLNGLCHFTRNKLASRTVASELGPQLSANSNVYGPDDTQFGNCTSRYDPFFTPKIQMVVQPDSEDDIPKIVQYANANGIPFLAMARRHGMTSTLSDFDGMQIDMSLLDKIEIQPDGKSVVLGGGVFAKNIMEKLWSAGYVTSSGSTSCVGLLGPALGGGRGRLEGYYGVVSDSFLKLNVVLANGTAITVSETEHPDLFWAMKGAGHNFGVVTSLEMKIYPRGVDTWYYKTYIWSQDKLERVFEASNNFHNDGNHAGHHLKEMAFNMGSYTIIPSISETEGVIFWSFVYRGSKEEAQPYLDAFDAIEAVSTEDGNVPYPDIPGVSGTGMNSALCDYGLNHVHYPAGLKVWNVTTQRQIYDLYNEKIRQYPEFQRTTVSMEDYSHEGVNAIDPDTSAYPWRDRGLLSFIAVTYDPNPSLDEAAIAWAKETRDLWNAGAPDLLPSTYVNYAHGDESTESMYGYEPWRLEKLRGLKAQYDPDNLFSYYNPIIPNQNPKSTHESNFQGRQIGAKSRGRGQ